MADSSDTVAGVVPADILDRYEVRNYRNAAQILAASSPAEFADLIAALRRFTLTVADIRKPGGNESDIPKQLATALRPTGWQETRIKGDLHITKLTGKPSRPAAADDGGESAFGSAE